MKRWKIITAVLLAVLLLGAVGYWHFFVSLKNLPEGELIREVPSLYSDCTLTLYRVNGGATTDYAVRGCITYENGRQKNIYWQYHASDARVLWLDKDTVVINDVTLNIRHDVYDYRRE